MIVHYYSLYDEVASRFKSPVPFANDKDAVRSYRDVIERCEANFQDGFYHRDSALYYIGSFDDATGTFKSSVKQLDNYLGAKAYLSEVKNDG